MPQVHAAQAGGDMPENGLPYAGDLTPQAAWTLLQEKPEALLVDVRTLPEWQFIGLPELSSLGKKPLCLSWKFYPTFETNGDFIAQLMREVTDKQTPLLFLCRSGGRSLDAAVAATEAGYAEAYNIAGGFEGEPDGQGHRGTTNGWKADNLPWEQQ